MALTIRSREVEGVVVLELVGRLVAGASAQRLRDTTRRFVADGRRAFVLNLAAVSQMDSGGLGEVVDLLRCVDGRQGAVVLLRPFQRAALLLQLAKLVTVFDIYDDEASAIAAVGTRVAA